MDKPSITRTRRSLVSQSQQAAEYYSLAIRRVRGITKFGHSKLGSIRPHFKINNHKSWIALLFFCLFFSSLYGTFLFTRHHDIHWDEAVYISMGKYLYSSDTQGLFESIRPLGLPLLLGFFWKLGSGTVLLYQTLIFIFAIGVVLLVYLLGKEIFSEEAGILAAAILVFTPLFFQSSIAILTEIPAVFFILLSIFLFVRGRKTFFVGAAASFAFLFKFPAGFVAIAILLLFLLQYYSHIRILFQQWTYFLLGFIVVQLPVFFFNYLHYKEHSATVFDALFRPVLLAGAHADNAVHAVNSGWENIFYYFLQLVSNNPLLLLGFLGFFAVLFSRLEKDKVLALFLPLLIFFVYFTSIVNKQPRFAVLFLPFLAVFAGHLFSSILSFFSRGEIVKKLLFVFLILYLFWTFSLQALFIEAYRFYPEEMLPIEQEYYLYFANNAAGTILLTTEPYFTAYTDDILAYPYYNNLTDAQEIYEKYKDSASYVVFTSNFYPCADASCLEQIEALHQEIAKTHTLVYSQEWNGQLREIFKR
jgi:4-amino-4-deoxy-L-arabinose transferase-like glycosyltransferase